MSAPVTEFVQRQLTFSPEVLEALARRADAASAPPPAVFVAAVGALLARYADRDEVAFDLESAAQRLRVRLHLDGEPDVEQLFARAAIALSQAARVSAADGGDARAEARGASPLPGARGDARIVLGLGEARAPSDADLVIVVAPQALELHFRAERFEPGAPGRIAEHLRALVLGLSRAAGPVAAIPIVQGEERAWILARSNAAEVNLSEVSPTVVECFERHARTAPDAIAIVEGERELSYGELFAAAEALAAALRARGVGSGVRVATYLERGAEAIVAFLGILAARGTYVPIDTGYPAGRVKDILDCAAPRSIVTRSSAAAELHAFGERELLFIDRYEQSEPAPERDPVRAEDSAYTFFTSGSTGRPKGVVIDHRTLGNYVRAAAEAYGVTATDRVLHAASLGFDLSLEEILVTLTAGATLVIRNAGPIESVQAFFDECTSGRLSVLSITAALWHELTLRLADGSAHLPPLIRLVILGADAARADVFPAWQSATGGRVRLVNSYGLTETTIVATVWEAGEQALSGDWRALPIGRPLRNVSTYVLDRNDELSPVGVAGEICIGGLAVGRGYLGDPELTRARFVPDPYVPGGTMYRTGDRGILRSSGELEFLGRADNQIKVRGVRIELGEIEARLREYPGVVEAVAVVRTDASGEKDIDAYVTVSSETVTSERLHRHLSAALPRAAVPTRVEVLERFPLTAAGKLDRRALAALPPRAQETSFVAPQTALETLVASTLGEVLGLPRVGLEAGFLALGGTSLLAVRAASVLGARLGRRLSAQLFLESPSLRELCEALESPESSRTAARGLGALEADARLAPDVRGRLGAPNPPPTLESVLLTGATGYFGTFVLAELLGETRAHVFCLVRAPSPDAARARLVASLERLGGSIDAATLAARVTCVCGDVARPWLGLSPATFQSLSERVDSIFHVAAQVSMLLPYSALRAPNALAIEWVLRLAATGKAKTLHHVSTVDVLGDLEPSDPLALAERATAPTPALLEGGYGQSKWVAEKLIEQARARGIPAYIHRPGRLAGHSVTGAFNDNDFLVQLLDACGRVGAVPDLSVDVDLTPVDAASRALVRLAESGPREHTFHLVRPEPPSFRDLVEMAIELGYPLRIVDHALWCSMLQELTSKDERATAVHYLASLSRAETEDSLRGGYGTEVTARVLGAGFEWPQVDARLIAIYLRALGDAGRFGSGPPRSSTVPAATRSLSALAASER